MKIQHSWNFNEWFKTTLFLLCLSRSGPDLSLLKILLSENAAQNFIKDGSFSFRVEYRDLVFSKGVPLLLNWVLLFSSKIYPKVTENLYKFSWKTIWGSSYLVWGNVLIYIRNIYIIFIVDFLNGKDLMVKQMFKMYCFISSCYIRKLNMIQRFFNP